VANKNFTVKNGLEVGGQEVISSSGTITSAALGGQVLGTSASPSFANITTAGYLRGPASFVIDPAAHGDDTGTVVIAGNLQVDGTQTTINSTTMTVDDLNLTLASGAANAAAANGAGITVDIAGATNPSLVYGSSNDDWTFNKNLNVTGALNVNVTGSDVDAVTITGDNVADFDFVANPPEFNLEDTSSNSGTKRARITVNDNQFQISALPDDDSAVSHYLFYGNLNNGNVGIGTDNPLDALHIASAVSTDYRGNLFLQDTTTMAAGVGGQVTFGGKYTAAGAITEWSAIQGTKSNASDDYSGQIEFKTRKQAYALETKMTLTSDGNLGIGTANPSRLQYGSVDPKLHVDQGWVTGSYNLTARFSAGGDENNTGASILINHSNDRGLLIEAGREISDTGIAHFGIVSSAGTNTRLMTLKQGGNVGIGTTSPANKLHVKAGASGATTFDSRYNLILEDNGENYLALYTPNNSFSGVRFLNADNSIRGHFDYYHGTQGDKFVMYSQNGWDFQYPSVGLQQQFKPNGNVNLGATHAGFSGWRVLNIRQSSSGGMVNFDEDDGTRAFTFANEGVGMRYQAHITGGYHRFETNALGAGTALMILDNGNVGIGLASPIDSKLVIVETPATIVGGNAINGSTMKGLKLRTNANGDESVGVWFGTNGSHWSGISGQRNNAASTWGTDLRFYTHEDAVADLTYARERMRIETNGRLRSSTKQYYLSSTAGRGDHYVHTGGHHGAGTYTLFTMPANVTQSAGLVEIWWIYGTPSAAGYTKYLITGNKSITTLETSGLNGTGNIPTLAWSGQDLRVTNSNGSTYYHVRVTLHEIGNPWNPTWGNLSGIA